VRRLNTQPGKRGAARRLIRRSVLLLVVVAALATITYTFWEPLIGNFLVVADPLQRADAIVPLAGGGERAGYAAALMADGYAAWLIASDVGPVPNGGGQLRSGENRDIAIAAGVPAERVVAIERAVFSTYQEAIAVLALAQKQRWRSLIVVTSPAHTRRSQMIFRAVFAGSGISVIVRPVVGFNYPADRPWQDSAHPAMVFNEYFKIVAFLLGYRGGWRG